MRKLAVLIMLAVCAGTACAAPLALTLRAEALLGHARITLADVAGVSAQDAALASLDLAAAPRVGYVERLSRAHIEQLLARRAGVTQVAWDGAASVAVRVRTQALAPEQLGAAARAAAQAAFGPRHSGLKVELAAQPAPLELPLGEYRIVARPLAAQPLAARVAVWLDVEVGGALYRSVVVALKLSARQSVYVARRTLAPGALVGQHELELREMDLAALDGAPALPAAAALPLRLRRGVAAGQVLGEAALAQPGMIYKGDQVRLVVRSGAIGIETDAVALADAAPGERVAVRSASAREAVTGRASAGGAVFIDFY